MSEPILQIMLISVLLAAVVMDLRSHKIHNWLTIPAMGCGVMVHSVMSGQAGLVFSASGLSVGLGLFLIPYLSGGMGAGDVKLLGAVGSFIGPVSVLWAALVIGLLGGVYALAVMVTHLGLRGSARQLKIWIMRSALASLPAPSVAISSPLPHLRYGLVIALGTILSRLSELHRLAF